MREVNAFAIVFLNQIVFVLLHNDTARHSRGFERHNQVQSILTDNHAAGMLSKMPRQVERTPAQAEEAADSRVAQVEAGLTKIGLE